MVYGRMSVLNTGIYITRALVKRKRDRESSSAADLTSRDRGDPAEREVEQNGDDADDPERLGVVRAIIHEAEDDAEEHAAEITGGARGAGDDAVGVRVDVRDEAEVAPVARLEEHGHEGDEADEDGQLVGVHHADGDEEGAG